MSTRGPVFDGFSSRDSPRGTARLPQTGLLRAKFSWTVPRIRQNTLARRRRQVFSSTFRSIGSLRKERELSARCEKVTPLTGC